MWLLHKGILRPWVRDSLLPETFPSVASLAGLQRHQMKNMLGRSKNLLQEFQNRPFGLTTASNSIVTLLSCEGLSQRLRMSFRTYLGFRLGSGSRKNHSSGFGYLVCIYT